MMYGQVIFAVYGFILTVLACPDHDFHKSGSPLQKRAEGQDWAYEASYNWGMINESKDE